MSKFLIALLALDMGVSLSKVFIFTWKSNFLAKKKKLFLKNKISYLLFLIWWIYFIEQIIKSTKELPIKFFLGLENSFNNEIIVSLSFIKKGT